MRPPTAWRVRRPLPALGISALLAGCGTTVSGTGAGSVAAPAGGGLAVPGGAAGAATAGATGLTAATGQSGSTTTGASTTLGGGGGASGAFGGGAGTSTTGPSAPGVTATSIQVGYLYSVNGAAANNAAGGAGITQGDEKGEAQVVINDINAHGGILGRKIVPVWYAIDALSNDTVESQYQAACAAFEQDHHVFAIMAGGLPVIESCAQRAGAVELYENLSISSSQTFRTYPAYVEVSMLDLDRIVLNEALGLEAQGYFSPWDTVNGRPASVGATKVGVIGYDTPDYHYAIDNVLRPELARLHHPVASQDLVYVAQPQRTSDLGQLSAEMANAVVRFHQDGVDHVLLIDDSGTLTLEFLNQADSQHYRPRYGWNSQNAPEALAGPGDVQPDQLVGSMGIGYFPVLDLTAQDNPDNGPYSNEARRSCLKLLTSHGFSFSDNNAKAVGLIICNQFRFLKTAIEAGGSHITQASFINGVNSLGSSFQTANEFSTYFSPAQHDGGGGYRYYQWNTGCGCMRYTSGTKPAIGEGVR